MSLRYRLSLLSVHYIYVDSKYTKKQWTPCITEYQHPSDKVLAALIISARPPLLLSLNQHLIYLELSFGDFRLDDLDTFKLFL